jgi:hypothetical protein
MKYWEIIADNLSKAGWSLGCVSAVDSSGSGQGMIGYPRLTSRLPMRTYFAGSLFFCASLPPQPAN